VSNTRLALKRLEMRQKISKKYNIPLDQILDLSTGNNLFIPPKLIQDILIRQVQFVDPRDDYPIQYNAFIDELSRFLNVQASTIYPGLTHTQLIQRAISCLTNTGDTILLFNPDKGVYQQIAINQNLKVKTLDLDNKFEPDLCTFFELLKNEKPKTILFSSPHYPTANQFKEEDILAILQQTDIPIIVDESYVEFGKYTLVNQVPRFDNLTVIRSFSKAWGLGAVSCAYLISNVELVNRLKKKFIIEEIPPIHILATIHILQSPYKFFELINNFLNERKRVISHLKMFNGVKVFKSDTNFLFLKVREETNKIVEGLSSKGIIIQTFEEFLQFKDKGKSFLVTLGDANINDRFILAFVELLESFL